MLAEIFMLRLESARRASQNSVPTSSDTRFVPIRLTSGTAKTEITEKREQSNEPSRLAAPN